MRKVLFLIACSFVFIKCISQNKKNSIIQEIEVQDKQGANLLLNEEIIDSLIFCKAIYYFPTESQVANITEKIGEKQFREVIFDNEFYYSPIISTLDSLGIPIELSNNTTFSFGTDTIKRNQLPKDSQKWGIILFKKNRTLILDHETSLDSVIVFFAPS